MATKQERLIMSAAFKRALDEIKSLPKCKITYSTSGYILFSLPYFYGRLLENKGDEHIVIHLAEKKTFDRWANSTNFTVRRPKGRRLYYGLFAPQVNWARKIVKSKLFNFDSYFSGIEMPYFEMGRNP